jgi:uncharacterized protein YdeI (YjbR/CyaY-like superfamily)
MGLGKTLYVTNRDDWRAWLAKHHKSHSEIWLIYYKKNSGQPRIPYDDAVEEALCFGWVDSIVKGIDPQKYAQKFTPRRDWTTWAPSNKQRLRKLIPEGKITKEVLAKIPPAILAEEPTTKPSKNGRDIPPFFKQALTANAKARKNFEKLPPSHRNAYIQWLTEAKKEETRQRRLQEALARLEQRKADLDSIPKFFKEALTANPKAWQNFQSLAPSYRRHYIGWLLHAAKDQTRQRRLREAISLLEQNKKLGLR